MYNRPPDLAPPGDLADAEEEGCPQESDFQENCNRKLEQASQCEVGKGKDWRQQCATAGHARIETKGRRKQSDKEQVGLRQERCCREISEKDLAEAHHELQQDGQTDGGRPSGQAGRKLEAGRDCPVPVSQVGVASQRRTGRPGSRFRAISAEARRTLYER